MKKTMIRTHKSTTAMHCHRQQGVALITVLVMMMLSLLLVIGSSRVSLLNERLSGNSTDYQRAYEAAEALLADAQLDLACIGKCGMRTGLTDFPCQPSEFQDLQTTLTALAPDPPCAHGICLDLGVETSGDPDESFWNKPARLTTFTSRNRAAQFGQYTVSTVTGTQAVNPLLVDRAWYWVEVLGYGAPAAMGSSYAALAAPQLDGWAVIDPSQCSVVFRVTAVAQGRRNGTTAVLQSLYSFRGMAPTP